MGSWPVALAVLAPLALMAWFIAARSGEGPRRALPWASVPALLAALLPGETLVLPDLLLGSRLAVDGAGRSLLLLVGLAWSAAGWFAADRVAERFRVFAIFWLAALAGLVIAALALDLVSFYTGYVAMTLASYGLVVHERNPAAQHAGRVYLVLAMAGEALLLSGLLIVGAQVGNAELAALPAALEGAAAELAAGLLIAGFAVKIGVVPLHVWLPLAHPVAPVPASAILSGVLVKAGLLGVLRTMPAVPFAGGEAAALMIALGLFTAFYGVAMGLGQRRLKTVLAYSTVSQMGLLFCALATTLSPGASRGGPLIALLVLHHGLNKAALFLAAGSAPGASRLRLALLALPALSIAGLPLTTGELAKSALKEALYGSALGAWASPLLGLSSLATALLMLRVFSLARSAPAGEAAVPAMHPAWWLLVAAAATVPWIQAALDGIARLPGGSAAWDALWPPVLAGMLALAWPAGAGRSIPEGDLLAPGEAVLAWMAGAARRMGRGWSATAAWMAAHRRRLLGMGPRVASLVERAESSMAALPVAGVLLLLLVGLLWGGLA